ncbi:MAG: hypothetical protein KAG20_11195 [Cocleimonas sp.]|nr:hypothetical protein [Cocleimonas sp.]
MANSNLPTEVLFSTNYSVRLYTDDNENPWFCHADICDVLGYKNSRTALSNHCKEKGVLKQDTLTDKGNQSVTYINEGNLYRLIVKSKKPEAEKFEEWLFEEVLPQIRKTGHYDVSKARISAEQLQAIRNAMTDVTRYLKHKGVSLANNLYRQLKAEFGYRKIEAMPADQFNEALAWINKHQSVSHQVYDMTCYIEREFIKMLKAGDYTDVNQVPQQVLESYQAPLLEA